MTVVELGKLLGAAVELTGAEFVAPVTVDPLFEVAVVEDPVAR